LLNFSTEEQLEREMACMRYLLERASIAQRHQDFEEARGFMKAMHKSFHQALDLQTKIEAKKQMKQFAVDMQAKGIQIHHLHYNIKPKK
jgi:hypothetical protein